MREEDEEEYKEEEEEYEDEDDEYEDEDKEEEVGGRAALGEEDEEEYQSYKNKIIQTEHTYLIPFHTHTHQEE